MQVRMRFFGRRIRLVPVAPVIMFLGLMCAAIPPDAARAQMVPSATFWLQIEAQPTLERARERAAAWTAEFDDVRGFRLASGWHAIALGPLSEDEARVARRRLVREGHIPRDSYVTDGQGYGASFWPPAGADVVSESSLMMTEPPVAERTDDVPDAPPASVEPVEPPETPAEARAREALLPPEEKQLIQEALAWSGFYAGAIDGVFGRGTREAISAWQRVAGVRETGVLLRDEQRELIDAHEREVAAFGFAHTKDDAAGIEAVLPLALVEFDRHDPPFARYRAREGSGLRILFISEPGDASMLGALYDLVQALRDIPRTGERTLDAREFSIHGRSASHDATAWAGLDDGMIKGWIVISEPGFEERDARVITALRTSFRSTGDATLDPGLLPLDEATRRGVLAGLEIERPRFSRSGTYVDATGAVLTSAGIASGCPRIMLDHAAEAHVVAESGGMALVRPDTPLAPRGVAAFDPAPPAIGATIEVAGYPYEGRLPAPALTRGTVEATIGLDGEKDLLRLGISTRAGDAGGPVISAAGAVIGILLPEDDEAPRTLPEGVAFAMKAATLADFLEEEGITADVATSSAPLAPVPRGRMARGMTALVSCWD